MTNIEIIKPNSLISIQVSNYFYSRIQSLATYLTKIVSEEELNLQINNIKTESKLSEFGEQFETVLILVQELEKQACEQGLVEITQIQDS